MRGTLATAFKPYADFGGLGPEPGDYVDDDVDDDAVDDDATDDDVVDDDVSPDDDAPVGDDDDNDACGC